MRDALDRTLLLMRDHLDPKVTDAELLAALAGVTVTIRSDAECAATHAGQSAIITLCALLARSGHRVQVDAPDALLSGLQPPARQTRLHTAIAEVASELPLHPGTTITHCALADIEFLLGGAEPSGHAPRTVRLGWSRWAATIGRDETAANETEWPIGALAAAAFGAAEAFKLAMRRLAHLALSRRFFDAQYSATAVASVRLAPESSPICSDLGEVDFVSAGAITNSALYVLLRLPGLQLHGRAFDDDENGLSNLNRNMLLLHRALGTHKSRDLAAIAPKGMLRGIIHRFGAAANDAQLAPRVLVGVDHIPSRWTVQRAAPGWVGIGATSHFIAFASAHPAGEACAGCMHPRDEPDFGPIPTVAFVSYWAGLLAAVKLVRDAGGDPTGETERQTMICPLRPETVWRSAIALRSDCPTPCRRTAVA